MTPIVRRCLAGLVALSSAGAGLAQEAKSPVLAKQVAAALDAAKLDSLAAKDPSTPGTYVAALYFPGAQLLVISAKYAVPVLLDQKLAKKEYRDIYLDLNGASVPDTKVFVEDFGADGLKLQRSENQPADSYEAAGKRTAFNSDWRAQKLSEEEYKKAFAMADARYSQMLTALLDALKKKP